MKDDNAVYVLPWCHLASFTLKWNMSHETRSCPVTGATVNAVRVGSQVDFAFAGNCVAPTRSSLMPDNSYLSCSSPCFLFCLYQHSSRGVFCQWLLVFLKNAYGVGVGVEVGVALPEGVGVGVGVVLPVRSHTWALLNSISVGTLSS